jgi:hypothetical protein
MFLQSGIPEGELKLSSGCRKEAYRKRTPVSKASGVHLRIMVPVTP